MTITRMAESQADRGDLVTPVEVDFQEDLADHPQLVGHQDPGGQVVKDHFRHLQRLCRSMPTELFRGPTRRSA